MIRFAFEGYHTGTEKEEEIKEVLNSVYVGFDGGRIFVRINNKEIEVPQGEDDFSVFVSVAK